MPSPDPSTVPDEMRAVVADGYGPPEQLRVETVPVPTPGPDQVLLRVAGASTNALDWHLVTAQPFFVRAVTGLRRPTLSTPGNDVSGTVVAVGTDVTRFAIGDQVFGNCNRGACAEYAVAPERHLEVVPDAVDLAESSTIGVAAFTALQAVRDHGRITAGARVLVIGASSGVGVSAVQFAAGAGAEVTALTSAANTEMIAGLGAHHVIDRTTTSTADVIGSVESGDRPPFDVVLDLAGAVPVKTLLPALSDSGPLVVVGGKKTGHLWPLVTLPATKLRSLLSSQTIVVFTARETPEDRRVLAGHLADGTLRPVIGDRIGLDGVSAAVRRHGDRTAVAKILVEP